MNTPSRTATSGTLSAWERSADGRWSRVLGPITAWVGSNGVGATREGISTTPAGTFPLTESFGRQPNPGTAMPYFQSDSNDWWSSNSSSPLYNTHVRQPNNPGGNSENLYGVGPVYDYAINMGYNLARTPGAGSAFFLHVTNGRPTAGCVSIDKSALVDILRWLTPDRNPYIDVRVGPEWSPSAQPIGALDQHGWVDPGSKSYRVEGWAIDPDAPAASIDVHVYDTAPDGSSHGVALHADGLRPDVGAAYPGAGPAHGYSGTVDVTGAGAHTICVYAIDTGGGPNTTLGCRTAQVPGPIGALDSVRNSAPGQLQADGWAADPQAAGVQEAVHVWLSGPTGLAGYATQTGGSRSDVFAAYPWSDPNRGFSVGLAAPVAGQYRACAYAINVHPPQTNPQIGCRSVTVADAFGVLDNVTVSGGALNIQGWALNPNAPADRGTVHVYDFGPTVRAFVLTADSPRGDVAAAFPGYDSSHGFSLTVPAGASGAHTVCAYAINAGGGSAVNPLLGCRSVTV